MKPKTIREKIRELVFDYSKPDGLNLGDTTDEILAQIQQLLEECAPKTCKDHTDTIVGQRGCMDCALTKWSSDQYKSNIRGKLK